MLNYFHLLIALMCLVAVFFTKSEYVAICCVFGMFEGIIAFLMDINIGRLKKKLGKS